MDILFDVVGLLFFSSFGPDLFLKSNVRSSKIDVYDWEREVKEGREQRETGNRKMGSGENCYPKST